MWKLVLGQAILVIADGGCPDGHDSSKCLHEGEYDKYCCAVPDQAACADGYRWSRRRSWGCSEGIQHSGYFGSCCVPPGVKLVAGSSNANGNLFFHGMGVCVVDGWNDFAAQVLCRTLGYVSGRFHKVSHFGGIGSGLPVKMACNGHERHIRECMHVLRAHDRCVKAAGVTCFECLEDTGCTHPFKAHCIRNRCRPCDRDVHCKDPSKPKCTRKGCRECRRDQDCNDSSKPKCVANVCTRCKSRPTALCATLFTNDRCPIDVEPGGTPFIGYAQDNKVHAVHVVDRCTLSLYTHEHFGKPMIEFTRRGNHILENIWAKQISSYKCSCQGQTHKYEDRGEGKCVLQNGKEVEGVEWYGNLSHKCEQKCDETPKCGGYSVNEYKNCLIYLRPPADLKLDPNSTASVWHCVVRRTVMFVDKGANKCGVHLESGVREPPFQWLRTSYCDVQCSVRPECGGYSMGLRESCLLWLANPRALVAVQEQTSWDARWDEEGGDTRCFVKNYTDVPAAKEGELEASGDFFV